MAKAIVRASIPTRLSGWGANSRVDCFVVHPDQPSAVARSLDPRGTIARGLGRSYGDPAINAGGQVIAMTGLDRYLSWDPHGAILECEAGVSLAQILTDFAPRGFMPKITPGTKFVTVGGCIANDVHGKAHHVQGSFAGSVESMQILLADGQEVTASRSENADLFWATFGGMGLLGIVLSARLRLSPVETTFFRQETFRARNLGEMLEKLDHADDKYPYSVAWIDPLATGRRLGRGVLVAGDHARRDELPAELSATPLKTSGAPRVTVPFELPELALNPITLRALNLVIERVQSNSAPFAHYEKFFYPLDAIGHWYRGYGRRGFTQWQFVIPFDQGEQRLRALFDRIARAGQLPFLNVLKRMGPAGQGWLSFPMAGYTFAVDFPIRRELPELLAELDREVLDAGGRVYLGKDSFLRRTTFEEMYPAVHRFRELKSRLDPEGLFTSNLGRRLGLAVA